MTYIVEKPAANNTGIERPLITIEFAPNIHPSETEYSYEHPRFVFGDQLCWYAERNRVILANEYPQLEFTVCALELIQSKTSSGKLLSQPRWKYKISNGEVSFEKEESALLRYKDTSSPNTCSTCSNFQNYNEPEFFAVDGEKIANKNPGKGWCCIHNRPAKTHHLKTNDCVLSGTLDKFSSEVKDALTTEVIEVGRESYPMLDTDSAPSKFQVKSIVKIIDPTEHHSEWGVFEVVQVKNNDHRFDNTDTYLNSSTWVYRLANTKYEDTYCRDLWVSENEICHFDESHLICTEDIF